MSTTGKELSLGQRLLYAVGSWSFEWIASTFVLFSIFRNSLLLDPADAETEIFGFGVFFFFGLIVMLVDAVASPVFGAMGDRAQNRRNWVLGGVAAMIVVALIGFSLPGMSSAAVTFAMILAVMVCFALAKAAAETNYEALLPELTGNNRERVEISIYLFWVLFPAIIIPTAFFGYFLKYEAFRLQVLVSGILAILLLFCVFKFLSKKQSAAPTDNAPAQKANGNVFFRLLPLLILSAVFLGMFQFLTNKEGTTLVNPNEYSASWFTSFPFLLAMILGIDFYWLVEKHGKKRWLARSLLLGGLGMALWAALLLAKYVAGLGQDLSLGTTAAIIFWALPVLLFIVPLAAFNYLIPVALCDAVDDEHARTGRNRAGFYFGMWRSFRALISGFVLSVLLSVFVPSYDQTTHWFLIIMAVLCAIAFPLVYLRFRSYPIEK